MATEDDQAYPIDLGAKNGKSKQRGQNENKPLDKGKVFQNAISSVKSSKQGGNSARVSNVSKSPNTREAVKTRPILDSSRMASVSNNSVQSSDNKTPCISALQRHVSNVMQMDKSEIKNYLTNNFVEEENHDETSGANLLSEQVMTMQSNQEATFDQRKSSASMIGAHLCKNPDQYTFHSSILFTTPLKVEDTPVIPNSTLSPNLASGRCSGQNFG